MSNVISIKDFLDIVYNLEDNNFAVVSKSNSVAIGFIDDIPAIQVGDIIIDFNRADLAKLLWASAYLMDSEQRWIEDSYPSKDY